MNKFKEFFRAVAIVILSVTAVGAFSKELYVDAMVFVIGAVVFAFTD